MGAPGFARSLDGRGLFFWWDDSGGEARDLRGKWGIGMKFGGE